MARPREFDIDEAVEKAMNLFWKNGYQGTNLPDLLDAMGIVRGSLYKAFGSKKALFLRTLELYDRLYVQPGIDMLEAEDCAGLASIKSVFDAALQRTEEGDRRGCLLCSSAAESSFHDTDIEAAVNGQLGRLTGAFAGALKRDEAFSTVPDTEIHAEAQRLALNYVGLRVMQRSGWEPASLKAGVERIFGERP